ncbi:MAG: antitoxin [Ilumatobacteraceae bacterium]
MRTTVTIEDDLLRRAKRRALERGETLSEVIDSALREQLAGTGRRRRSDRFRLRLITAGGSGLRNGVDLGDNAATRDVMDGVS